jgi:AmiR/NasT family two-component response regulator
MMQALRVVVADDESIIRLDLKETLRKMGHEVVGEAGDGRTAVDLARKLKPDVVMMDIKMPELDGIDAAKVISQEKVAPVVLVTAYSQLDLVKRAEDAGVFAYVVKPFTESALLPAIGIAIARYREFLDISQQAATLQDALEARKLIERAKGVLMEKQGLSEQEAYRRIQQQSMNLRRTMREIAEAILIAEEV